MIGIPQTDKSDYWTAIYTCLRHLILVVVILAGFGCASSGPYQLDLMPVPEFFQAIFDPFTKNRPSESVAVSKILYATDREPAKSNVPELYYANQRGFVVRLGSASVTLGPSGTTWEEVSRTALLKNRDQAFPLRVSGVEELGILDATLVPWMTYGAHVQKSSKPRCEFARLINKELVDSRRKDIYVYVHGYKVTFENPVLVAAELWHFMRYEGVAVAYAWPATPRRLAYVSDVETTVSSARNFRIFLDYLARETDAERIHIVGYSAGTRIVITALAQLALLHADKSKAELRNRLKIGHTILVGSDFDGSIFGGYVFDGLLNVPATLTLYASATDSALGLSRWLFARGRLGQVERSLSAQSKQFLWHYDDYLSAIDVTNAARAGVGNGHQYFRQSPWVSSDILATLLYGLTPSERGLTRTRGDPIWRFPADFMDKLTSISARQP